MPVEWSGHEFVVGGLGAVVANGTRANGVLQSVPGACFLGGNQVEVTAYWSVAGDGGPQLGAVAAGRRGGPPMSDDDSDTLRDLLEEALSDWWASGFGAAMADANELRERDSGLADASARLTEIQARRAALVSAVASGFNTVAGMEAAIRELAELGREEKALDGLLSGRQRPGGTVPDMEHAA